MASYFRHIPPAPLNVGIPGQVQLTAVVTHFDGVPEAADSPAPATAIIFLDECRHSWKAFMSFEGAMGGT